MASVPKPFVTPEEYLHRERKAEFRLEYYQGEMFAMDCFTHCSDGNWSLDSCQTLEGRLELKAIDCLLTAADVYDKVVFPS